MNFNRYAGMAAAVGIVLLLTIVILVGSLEPITTGISGPITILRLLNYAAKWQTLMTGCLAIIGVTVAYYSATLAYRGAMAKVDFDRDRERRELERKKLGLYLRLRHAAEKLREESDEVKVRIGFGALTSVRKLSTSQIPLTNRREFDDAWNNLELLPASMSFELDIIRTELPRAAKRLASIPETDVIEINIIGAHDFHPLGEYLKIAEKLAKSTKRIIDKLDDEISTFEAR